MDDKMVKKLRKSNVATFAADIGQLPLLLAEEGRKWFKSDVRMLSESRRLIHFLR